MEILPKGLPLTARRDNEWNVFGGDVALPVAVIVESALERNAVAMRDYCARHGVSLAPHGKTTMAPLLFRRQLDHGAWAITAATTRQAATMRAAGVERVLIANEVVVPAEIAWLAAATADGFEVYCYADSRDGVDILEASLSAAGTTAPLPVLLEYGIIGGRTGVRTIAAGLEVAEAIEASPHLVLAGVSGFEGVITATAERSAEAAVDEFLDGIVELTEAVAAKGWFAQTAEVIVSAGGSAYFDHVTDRFARLSIDDPVRVVLRSGCYITHDDGASAATSPLGGELAPAIEVWGAVLSRPEPTRAIVGIGKRDASHDGLLPVAKKICRRGSSTVEAIEPLRAVALNDQHLYLDVEAETQLAVGDLVGFGISHPCTTFDKWRSMLLVDDDYNVMATVDTQF
jgi:D-serine dehydratase